MTAAYQTEYDIGNRALVHCGISPNIGSTWTGSKNAVVMGFLYDKVRQFELRQHIWKFSIVVTTLVLASTVNFQGPVTKNLFTLPSDYIRVADQDARAQGTNFERTSGGVQYSDWQFVQQGIVTSSSALASFWYCQDISTVTLFDPMFAEAFAASLAMAALPALTQSPQKLQQIEPIYADFIARAIKLDAIEVGNMEPVGDALKTERLNISLMPQQPQKGGRNG